MLLFTGEQLESKVNRDRFYIPIRNHSGRTVSQEGWHNDYKNIARLGIYHFHHGLPPHMHPNGICPCEKPKVSLIDLLREYQASIFSAKEILDGRITYAFEAIITLEPNKKYLTLETGGEDGFYLITDGEKVLKEKFFGTDLSPMYISREDSPWIGSEGGFDYMVDEDYFKSIMKKYGVVVHYQTKYLLDSDGNFIANGEITRYPLTYINFIKEYETHDKVGDIHVVSNAGQTIAYGHDIDTENGESFPDGLNEYQAINLLLDDLDEKYTLISEIYIPALNSNFGYNINIDDFSENELLFLNDFAFNRGSGLVAREDLENEGKEPFSSLAISIAAVSIKDDAKIIKTLKEETKSERGEYYSGLELRRMDEYEILKRGDFKRDYDIERGYK